MAERYAKARMLHQDEARDDVVRRLCRQFEDRADGFGAVVLWHRTIARLDVRGAILFEPSWLHSECFLGYPCTLEDVTRWANAILDQELLEAYHVDGIRYAWSRTFYKNNPRLQYQYEDPRFPRPPGFDFDRLYPKDRPGPTPRVPDWVEKANEAASGRLSGETGGGGVHSDPEGPRKPADVDYGGIAIEGGSTARIEDLEAKVANGDEALLAGLRLYALQFCLESSRAERELERLRYVAVLSTVHLWKQEGGVLYRGTRVPWDPERYALAFREVGERLFDTSLRSHKYATELLVDENWPPKGGEKPQNAPQPDRPDESTEAARAKARARGRREVERIEAEKEAAEKSAADEWRAKVRKYLDGLERADRTRLLQRAKSIVDENKASADLERAAPTVYAAHVERKLHELAAAEGGIEKPET